MPLQPPPSSNILSRPPPPASPPPPTPSPPLFTPPPPASPPAAPFIPAVTRFMPDPRPCTLAERRRRSTSNTLTTSPTQSSTPPNTHSNSSNSNNMGAKTDPLSTAKPVSRPPHLLPSALEHLNVLMADMIAQRRRLVLFLDYDGTLSPIVDDPDSASIPEQTRSALSMVADNYPVAIVTGRSLKKVKNMVRLEGLIYAGSHGFDIQGPQGAISHTVAADYVPSLQKVYNSLSRLVPKYPGSSVEDNMLSVSFHYRKVDPALFKRLTRDVDNVIEQHGLQRKDGKMVYEARPIFDWHKGKAVEYLLNTLDLVDDDVLPIYIGDDVTDEDAFKVLQGRGLGIIVADEKLGRDTYADMRLNDPYEVQKFLMRVAGDEQLKRFSSAK